MESYENVELTFKELAQIALGTPRLTCVNTAVLHSLLDLILKKLKCHNDRVSIDGFEAMCLDEMQCQSNISPLAFNDERVTISMGQFDNLDEMEKHIGEMEARIDCHLEEIKRKLDPKKDPIPPCHPIEYDYEVCEDICVACDPDNRIACQLLQSTDFVKKLMRRMAAPIVERIFALEKKLEVLEKELCCMISRAESEYAKVGLIEDLINDIDELRQLFIKNHLKFQATMEELQDMLDAKVDKYHMPPLKQFIHAHLDEYTRILDDIQAQANSIKAAGIVWENKEPAPKEPEKPAPLHKFCGCTGECLASTRARTLMERVNKLDVDQIAVQLDNCEYRRSYKTPDAAGLGRVVLQKNDDGFVFSERTSKSGRRPSSLPFEVKLVD